MKRKLFWNGAKGAVPVCLGIVPVGISYGILAMQARLSRLQTVLMSVLVMAGSSQLMAVGMLGSAATVSILTAVFFVNLCHIMMSSCVMNRLGHTSLREKLLCAFALCDESFALFSLSGNQSAAQLLGANTALYGILGSQLCRRVRAGAVFAGGRFQELRRCVLRGVSGNAAAKCAEVPQGCPIGTAIGTFFVEAVNDEQA